MRSWLSAFMNETDLNHLLPPVSRLFELLWPHNTGRKAAAAQGPPASAAWAGSLGLPVFSGVYYLQREQTTQTGRTMCQDWNYRTKVKLSFSFIWLALWCPLLSFLELPTLTIKPLVQPGKPVSFGQKGLWKIKHFPLNNKKACLLFDVWQLKSKQRTFKPQWAVCLLRACWTEYLLIMLCAVHSSCFTSIKIFSNNR